MSSVELLKTLSPAHADALLDVLIESTQSVQQAMDADPKLEAATEEWLGELMAQVAIRAFTLGITVATNPMLRHKTPSSLN